MIEKKDETRFCWKEEKLRIREGKLHGVQSTCLVAVLSLVSGALLLSEDVKMLVDISPAASFSCSAAGEVCSRDQRMRKWRG